jgi:hypothetical protein
MLLRRPRAASCRLVWPAYCADVMILPRRSEGGWLGAPACLRPAAIPAWARSNPRTAGRTPVLQRSIAAVAALGSGTRNGHATALPACVSSRRTGAHECVAQVPERVPGAIFVKTVVPNRQ